MLKTITKPEQKALKEFKSLLEESLPEEIVLMKLFGSKARGDARKDSDIDVLVVTKSDDWRMCNVVYGIVTDILLEEEICISPKVISKSHYDYLVNLEAPFIKNVNREGVAL